LDEHLRGPCCKTRLPVAAWPWALRCFAQIAGTQAVPADAKLLVPLPGAVVLGQVPVTGRETP
jgi:hypothetical protein